MYKKSILSLVTVVCSFIAVSAMLGSCEIGLGPSVDTEAPTIAITYPDAAAVIKDQFVLYGDWGDDKGVTKISVEVQNTSGTTKTKFGPYAATVNANKKWSVTLNQPSTASDAVNGWTFPDGKYELSVTAYDASGHSSGVTSRAVEIDNTAPLFIISSPGITDIANPTAYGSSLSIGGTIVDDHTISEMSVRVYDASGAKVADAPFTETSVETAGGTSVTIAKYVSGGTDEVNSRYTTMYGTDPSRGTVTYTCSVTLTDSAKIYQNPEEETNTTTGNSTSNLYLYDTVYSTLLSSKNGGFGLEPTDIKNVINGTAGLSVTRSAGTIDVSKVVKVLNESIIDTTDSTKRLAFSLNPKANPQYVISGYTLKYAVDGTTVDLNELGTATQKQPISVAVTAGLDGVLVEPKTLKAYIKEYDVSTFTKNTYSAFINDPTTGVEIGNNESYKSSSQSSYTWSFSLPESISAKKYYVLAITGADKDGTALISTDAYGFMGSVTGIAPEIVVDEPTELFSAISSDAITFTGTTKSKTSIVDHIDCVITVTDESKSSKESGYKIGTITGTATISGTADSNGATWSFSPKDGTEVKAGTASCFAAPESGKRYLYSAQFTAVDEINLTTVATRNVHVDTLKPAVVISTVTPVVTVGTVNKVNGSILISGSVDEAELANVSYSVYIDNNTTPVVTTSLDKVYQFNCTIDTTKYTNGKAIAVVVTASDKAGNVNSYSTTAFNNGTAYIIDQTTDAPAMTSNGFVTTIADQAGIISNGKNLFSTSGNNQLLATVTDDDGTDTVTIALTNKTTATLVETKEFKAEKAKAYSLSYTLPAVEAVYDVAVTIKDAAQNATGYNTTRYTFCVAVDKGAPEFKVTTTSGEYHAKGSTLAINGTVVDSGTPLAIKAFATETDAAAETNELRTIIVNGSTWTDSINITTDDGDTIYYTAKDCYGQKSSASFVYKVDGIAPTVENPQFPDATLVMLDVSSYARLAVSAEDKGETPTGVASAYYQIAETKPTFADDTGWSPLSLSTGTTWTGNVDFKGLSDGTANVWVAAKDNAGNRTVCDTAATITIDTKKPVLTLSDDSNKVSSGNDVKLTIKVTDTNPTAPTVTVGGLSVTPVKGTANAGDTTWTATLPFNSTTNELKDNGTYTVTVSESDANGRAADEATYTILKDKSAPVLSVSPTGSSFSNGTTQTFSGTVTDANLATVTVQLYKNGAAEGSPADITSSVDGSGNWTWKKYELSTGSAYRVEVTAKDKVNNTSSATSGTITIDTTAPTIKSAEMTDGSLYLTGTGNAGGRVPTPALGASYITDGAFTLKGSIEETNFKSAKISVSKNNTTPTETTISAAGAWSYEQAKAEGTYVYTITATDAANNVASSSITVMVDTTAPAVEVTSPAQDEPLSTSTTTLQGTVSDASSGVAEVTYSIKNSDNSEVSSGTATVTGSSWKATDVSLGSTEGTLKLTVTAKDKLNNTAVTSERTFYYDTGYPTVTETAITASGKTINSKAITLSGTASDSNALYNGGTGAVVVKQDATTLGTADVTTGGNWTCSLSGLAEGSHSLTIIVTDAATKTATITRSLRVDATEPTAGNPTVGSALVKLDESAYNTITATASDTGTEPTGVATVYYQVTASTAAVPEFSATKVADWTAMSQGTSSYTATANFGALAEGGYKVYTAAKDNAGNYSAVCTAPATFTVDKQKPVITVSGAKVTNAGSDVKLTIAVNDTNAADPTVSVKNPAGATVAVTITSTVVTTGTEWTAVVPFKTNATLFGTDGTYTVTVSDKDKNNRAADNVEWKILKDTTAPTVTITNANVSTVSKLSDNALITESNAYYSSSTYTVSGTWTDGDSGTGTSKLYYTKSASYATLTAIGSDAATQWVDMGATASASGTTNWSFAIPVTEGNGQVLAFYAVDVSGNKTTPVGYTGLKYDFSAPEVTIESYSDTVSDSGDLTFKVKGHDSKEISAVSVTAANSIATVVENTDWTVAPTTSETDDTNNCYKTITIKTGTHHDGVWTFTVGATDASGRSAEKKQIVVKVDSTAPILTVSNATSDVANLVTDKLITEENSSYKKIGSSTYYVLTGTWSDAVSGTKELYYTTSSGYATATIGTDPATNWVAVNGVSQTTTETSWTVNVPLSEGTEKLIAVKGKDDLDNWTTVTANSTLFTGLTVDYSAPTATMTTTSSYVGKGGSISITGTVTDSRAVPTATPYGISVTATRNGAPATGFTLTPVHTDANNNAYTIALAAQDNHSVDGTWVFTLTGADAAGRTVTKVSPAVIIDTTAPTIGVNTPGATYINKANAQKYSGTVSDSLSGIDGVYYVALEHGIAAPTGYGSRSDWTACATNSAGTTWNVTADLSALSDNTTYELYFVARDKAGNSSSVVTFTQICDATDPVLNIIAPSAATATNAETTISGTVTELNLTGFTVQVSKNGAAATDYTTSLIAASLASSTAKPWSFKLPKTYGDGTYVFTITAVDAAGHAVSANTKAITLDTVAPVLAFTQPATDGTYSNVFNQTIKGTATEATSGLATLDISYDGGTNYADLTPASSWIATNTFTSDGEKNIKIKATDAAGNASAVVTRTLVIDTTAPTTTLTSKAKLFTTAGVEVAANTSLTGGSAYYAGGAFTLGGTITETNFSTASLKVSKDGAAASAVAFTKAPTAADKTWTYAQNDTNGKYVYTISLTDAAGNSSTATVTVTVDTGAPAITVTNATSDLANLVTDKLITETNSSYKKSGSNTYYVLSGKWSDTYTGTSKLYYTTASGYASLTPLTANIGTDPATQWVEVSGVSQTTTETNWTIDVPLTEGSGKAIAVKAVDLIGNETTPAVSTTAFSELTVDYGIPVISLTSTSGSYTKEGGTFVLNGTVTDTRGVDVSNIAVVAKCHGSVKTTVDNEYTLAFTPASGSATNVSFTATVFGKVANDGNWNFTVNATDISGRAAVEKTYTTVVDATVPAISTLTAKGTTPNASTYYKESSLSIAGTVNEYTAYDATNGYKGSGVQKIYYWLNGASKDSNTYITPGSSATASPYATSFSSILAGFTENSVNTLHVELEDAAGNLSGTIDYTINIDATPPSVAATTYSFDGNTTTASVPGTVLTNKQYDLTLNGTCSDTMSGVSAVKVYIGTTSVGTITYTETAGKKTGWKAVIAKAKLPSVATPVYVEATDVATNTYKVSSFILSIDEQAPTATLTTPSTSAKLNGTVTFKGTAYDDLTDPSDKKGALSKLSVYYSTTDSTVATMDATHLIGSTTGTDMYNWSFDKEVSGSPTAILTSGETTNLYVRVVALDTAANTNSSTVYTLHIDCNGDRPIIKFTNIKVGTTSMLKMSNMVYGTITDDDGSIGTGAYTGTGSSATFTGFWYTTDSTATAPTYTTVYDSSNTTDLTKPNAAGTWHSITVESGSWTASATGSDGLKTWYFYAVDPNDTKFYSNSTETLKRPYLASTTETVSDKQSVSFNVDTTAPTISDYYFARMPTGTTEAPAVGDAAWVDTSNLTFGGENNVLFIQVPVEEATGMDATTPITVEFADVDKTASLTITDKITDHSYTAGTPNYRYIIGPIVINNVFAADGTTTVKITAKDTSALTKPVSRNIVVDNTAPTITVTAPDPTTRITSTTTARGSYADNSGGSGISSIKWMIPLKDVTPTTTTTTGWNDMSSGSGATWTIDFTSSADGNLANPMTYCKSASGSYTYNVENNPSGKGTSYFNVPIYFLMKDKLGNASVSSTTMLVDIDGGKPVAEMIYPTYVADKTKCLSLGGIIRAYGTATDIDGTIAKVEMQLDVNGDGNYDANDYGIINDWATTKAYAPYAGQVFYTSDTEWGFTVKDGKENWSIQLNQKKELDSYKTSPIGIRVRTYDNLGQTHGWSTTTWIQINTDVPLIGESNTLYLRQYTDNNDPTSAVKATMTYYDGIFISGKWWLYAPIMDTQGIKSVTLEATSGSVDTSNSLTNSSTSTVTTTGGTVYVPVQITVDTSNYSNGHRDYYMNIPLYEDRANGTTKEIITKITVKDASESGYETQRTFTVKVDNDAPTVHKAADGSATNVETADLRVKNGESALGSSNVVTQSNYGFTIGDTLEESGSGFERLVFYFERQATAASGADAVARVYNPMFADNAHGDTYKSRTDLSATAGSGKLYINGEKLPAFQCEGTFTTVNTFTPTTATQVTANYNIRVGGTVKINGVYNMITGVDRSTGVVTFNNAVETSYVNASTTLEFIYGMVVDHLTTESRSGATDVDSEGNLKVASGSDDTSWPDGMIESIDHQGKSYDWTATINSKHIVDGPIEIHVVAFDKAGNFVHGYVTTSVQNNRPRMARVMLATDLNANGTFNYDTNQTTVNGIATNGEFSTYSALDENAKTQYVATLTSTGFTAKNRLLVLPEFVNDDASISGNGALSYIAAIVTQGTNATTAATGTTAALVSKADLIDSAKNYIRDTTTGVAPTEAQNLISTKGGVVLENTALGGTAGTYEGAKTIQLSFWDSTEGLTAGAATNGSQWAVLNIPLTIDIVDNVAPYAHIHPFYWNSASDNSLYGNSSTNGHIELEGDLPTATFSATSGLFDIDPKVSGKIRITGDAYDETLLKEIWMQITDITLGSGTASTMTKLASYSTGSWTLTTAAGAMVTNFIVKDPNGPTQLGHKVTWELDIDTSKLANVAGTDKVILVKAIDASTAGNSSGTTSTTNTTSTTVYATDVESDAGKYYTTAALAKAAGTADVTLAAGITPIKGSADATYANVYAYQCATTPYYRVDVVPYITGVTRNSTYNTNRARSGAYPLLRGEASNTVAGFNISATIAKDSVFVATAKNGSTGTDMTITAASDGLITFTVPTTTMSGWMQLKVNGVSALNNVNGYKTYNTETNSKAYDHNTLTDDRYVQIWRVSQEDTFAGSKNCVYPAMSKSTGGQLYASFTNYGQSKTYYSESFIGTGTVGVSDYIGYYGYYGYNTPDPSPQNGVATVFNGYDPPEETDIVVGSDDEINVFYAANYHGGSASNWNGTSATDAGGIYIFDTHATSLYNNRSYHNIYRGELYTYDDELQQFKNLRIARANSIVYTAYYDRLRNSIKVSIVNDTDAKKGDVASRPNTGTNALSWVTIDGDSDATDKTGSGFSFAGGWTPTTLADSQYESTATRTTGTGESVAITTNKNGYPVILYMDASTGQLRIARAKSATPTTSDSWFVQGVFASTDTNYNTASDYMSCIVDSSGNLHIAFQNTKGQLVYAKSTNAPTNGTTKYTFGSSQVLDDSGMWIDMTLNGTTPYISYLSKVNSYDGMKIAYVDSNYDGDNNGVAEGGWETMTAPLNAKVTNVRTCIETTAKANDATAYAAAIGFCPGSDYRAAFFVGK